MPHSLPVPATPAASATSLKRSVALVVEEAVLAVAGDVEVVEAVVVIVADAGALAPTGREEAGLGGDVGEGAVVVVVEEMVGGFCCCRGRSRSSEFASVDEEDVGPAVAVVVEDGDAGAGGFDDVALGVDAAVDVADGDAGFGGDVDEPGWGWVVGGGGVGVLGLSGCRKEESDQKNARAMRSGWRSWVEKRVLRCAQLF